MKIDQAHELTRQALANYAQVTGHPCCGDDSWRGQLCQYHEGFDDGVEAALLIAVEVDEAQP